MGIQKTVGSCQMGGSCVRGGSDPCLSEQGPKSIQVCDFCWRVVLGGPREGHCGGGKPGGGVGGECPPPSGAR